jgi:hypothetical protein
MGAQDELHLGESLLQNLQVLFLKGTQVLNAVAEMNGLRFKFRQAADPLPQLVIPNIEGAIYVPTLRNL